MINPKLRDRSGHRAILQQARGTSTTLTSLGRSQTGCIRDWKNIGRMWLRPSSTMPTLRVQSQYIWEGCASGQASDDSGDARYWQMPHTLLATTPSHPFTFNAGGCISRYIELVCNEMPFEDGGIPPANRQQAKVLARSLRSAGFYGGGA